MDIVIIGGELAVILLIIILSAQEIFSESKWNKRISTILSLLTTSLLFVFIIIVVFRVLEILHS